jgi:succinate-semialdehyde dehydrogenase/glutarate-semialdehyde dehydrogenase
MRYATLSPYNDELLARFPLHSERALRTILRKATQGAQLNSSANFSQRAAKLQQVAILLQQNKPALANLITLEMGKPINQSHAEIDKCIWVCNYYAENTRHFLGDKIISTNHQLSMVCHEPLGVILAIMPWNFPFWQVFRFGAAALMAGNALIVKHAPNVPQCALAIEDLFKKAHFLDGVYQNVFANEVQIKNLIENAQVKAVTFTGSFAAGSQVAAIAGKNVKKIVLELGGSDSFIVLPDANVKQAIDTAIQSRMNNSGQSCLAAKRFIVTPQVYPDFLSGMIEGVRQLKMGNPFDETTQIGPIARLDLLVTLEKQLKNSLKMGAEVAIGGIRAPKKGFFYQPTILTNVKPGMPCFDEEVFGPVASITLAHNEIDALQLANQTKYGLGASIWSTNVERAKRFAKLLQVGNVYINTLPQSDPRLPFGGTKASGYGRELSQYGLQEFVNIKTVVVN